MKQEQEEYRQEGIEWQTVEFFNNQIICDLVERPHQGVFAIMDEACLNVGKITDEVSSSEPSAVSCRQTKTRKLNLVSVDASRRYGQKAKQSSAL